MNPINTESSAHPQQQPIPYRLLAVLLTLYFAQGLPAGFITQALPAILRQYEVSLALIGWSGLLLAPWAFKFLWAPVVDRYYHRGWGRSRSWIVPLQLISAAIVAIIAFINPDSLSQGGSVVTLYVWLFLLSLVGATHDVAADSLATRALAFGGISKTHIPPDKQHSITGDTRPPLNNSQPEDLEIIAVDIATTSQSVDTAEVTNPFKGMGNATQVIGYRMGLIIGGGAFLMVLGTLSWRLSFLAMAGLILVNTLPIWRYRERPDKHDNPEPSAILSIETGIGSFRQPMSDAKTVSRQGVWQYVQSQYGYFWQDASMRAWLWVLLTYKITDGISSGMVKPMMVDMGISTAQIGFWVSMLGSGASLVGAAIAAWVLRYVSHHRTLFWFNGLQVATTGLYAVVAYAFEQGHQPPFWWAYAANAAEHLAASLALVAMLTMVMHYARRDKAGSDFTTQVCLLTVFSGFAHLLSGYLAEWLGYTTHFGMSVALGTILLLPILYWQSQFK